MIPPLRIIMILVGLLIVMVICLTGCNHAPTLLPATDTRIASYTPRASPTTTSTATSSPSATITPIPPSLTPSYLPTLTPFPTEIKLDIIGQIGGYASAVSVKDKVAYLGVGPKVLVLDVSDPQSPKQIGQSGILPGMIRDIAIYEDLVYVAVGTGGLRILDLSNPTEPRVIGSVSSDGFTDRVIVQEQVAFIEEFLGDYPNQREIIHLVDVVNPSSPQEISRLEGRIVDIQGNYAYINQDGGMKVFDISDPRSVRKITDTGLKDVDAVSGQYAYTINVISDTLSIVDISNLYKPLEQGELKIKNDYLEHLNGITIINDRYIILECIFVGESAYSSSTLYIVDVTNHNSPQLVNSWRGTDREQRMGGMSGGIADAILIDGLLFIAKGDTYSGNGLFIVDVSDPVNPVNVGSFHVFGVALNAVGTGDHAYVLNGYFPDYLNLVDLTNGKDIQDRGVIYPVRFGDEMELISNDLYLSGSTSSDTWGHILDITNPANPLSIDKDITGLESFSSIQVVDHSACIGNFTNGIGFYDLTDPSRPRQVSRLADGYQYLACSKNVIFYGEDQNYSSNFSTLHIVELFEKTPPRELSTIDIPKGVIDLAYQDGFLYLIIDPGSIWEDASLIVLDVSDLSRPRQVASMKINKYPSNISIQGHYAYIANGDVLIVDISNPTKPRPVGFLDIPGNALRIMVVKDVMYIAAAGAGLIIVHMHK